MKRISILGSTGSIGTQTLEIVEAFSDQFVIVGLAAGKRLAVLQEQILRFRPEFVSVISDHDARIISDFIKVQQLNTSVFYGEEGLCQIATTGDLDLVVSAIAGTTGIRPTFLAVEAGIDIGLACKEVLVSAGDIVMAEARKRGVAILPIDSEHAAVHQCLQGLRQPDGIAAIVLTASGGPFREWSLEDMKAISVSQALKHPKWKMGPKITIDSATLMNKGLEVIEAHHLFGVSFDRIRVVIHPQSIIHSMVEFCDGTILAQMGLPDMRLPIQYALTYPDQIRAPWPRTDIMALPALGFYPVDQTKFSLLQLAYDCGEKGGTWPVVMNAANEVAVTWFLAGKIGFLDIMRYVMDTVNQFDHFMEPTLADILRIDSQIKKTAG